MNSPLKEEYWDEAKTSSFTVAVTSRATIVSIHALEFAHNQDIRIFDAFFYFFNGL